MRRNLQLIVQSLLLLLFSVGCGQQSSDSADSVRAYTKARPTTFACGSRSTLSDAGGTRRFDTAKAIVAHYADQGETFQVKPRKRVGYVWARDGSLRLRIELEYYPHEGWVEGPIEACAL